MKISNFLTVIILAVFLIGTVESNRFLALLVPYDVYVGKESQEQQKLNHQNANMRRSTRSQFDHHFYMDRRSIQNCAVDSEHVNTYLAMDRLCEACHEMYRHTDPNIRANCRSNCFDNDDFVFCFTHFAGIQVARGQRRFSPVK